jgi:4'-phosphopantetheinyl transferase
MQMAALSGAQLKEYTHKRARHGAPGRLDLWLLSTDLNDVDREVYVSVLAREERERAGRFHFEADRNRFLAGRAGLRWILSLYCGIPPRELLFQTGAHGKPALICAPPAFNVSHSGDYALVAVTAGPACGVDIEYQKPRADEGGIARRFFSPREVEWLKRTKDGFLRLWTAKEAIIKAVGGGLSIPLADVDVTDIVDRKSRTMTLNTSGLPPQNLWLQELAPVAGYAAAVAVLDEPFTVHCMPDV